MPSHSPVTLHDLARAAGVSVMTVSRALRGEPRVAEETRGRILALADSLGYQPDPDLARLMERVRSRKTVKFRSVIAVIREWVPDDGLLSPSYQYVPLEPIRERARGHGYEVEEFWLGRDGLTPKKLGKALHARGIEAVIVSPPPHRPRAFGGKGSEGMKKEISSNLRAPGSADASLPRSRRCRKLAAR